MIELLLYAPCMQSLSTSYMHTIYSGSIYYMQGNRRSLEVQQKLRMRKTSHNSFVAWVEQMARGTAGDSPIN